MSSKNKVKIFCVYNQKDHKKRDKFLSSKVFELIQTGCAKTDIDLGYLKDNSGDNISELNTYYGELTAHYWVWKNWLKEHPECEYIGFCHYRRFLDFRHFQTDKEAFTPISKQEMSYILKKTYNSNKILKNIKDYDVIVSKPFDFGEVYVYNQPDEFAGQIEVQKFKKCLLKIYPEYVKYIDKFLNGHTMSLGLVFLIKKELFVEWMEWLFNIFEEYKKVTNFSTYENTYEVRMPAFMAERYFNVWLEYKKDHFGTKTFYTESYVVNDPNSKKEHILSNLFSIKNEYNYSKGIKRKIFNICGIKLKFKVKSNLKPKEIVLDKNYFLKKTFDAFIDIDVRVDSYFKKFVNILAPAPKYNMSAGPLSIYYLAKKLCEWGYNVRIIPFCEEVGGLDWKEVLISHDKNFENVTEKLAYDRGLLDNKKVYANPDDMTIATWFATAYYAHKIQEKCNDKKFIYMIQDYESEFFAKDSNYAIAENTYYLPHYSLFSTDILENFFLTNNIGNISSEKQNHISYPCPANSYLPTIEEYKKRENKKKFVFYAREHAPRNAYELSVLAIMKAIEEGIFKTEEWDFYGIGALNNRKIELQKNVYLKQLPNMSLEEYKKFIPSCDIALSLMLTPHTSMPPIDLALSGVVTITNTSKEKTEEVFENISKNIVAVKPDINSIVEGFSVGLEKINNIEERYNDAKMVSYPSDWNNVFTKKHKDWFENILRR